MCIFIHKYIYTFHSRQCRLFAAMPRVRGHAARMRQCRIRSVSVLTVYLFLVVHCNYGCRTATMVCSGIAAC